MEKRKRISVDEVLRAKKYAEAQGWHIHPGVYCAPDSKACCPVTAVVAMHNGRSLEHDRGYLGRAEIFHSVIDEFVQGFDGWYRQNRSVWGSDELNAYLDGRRARIALYGWKSVKLIQRLRAVANAKAAGGA